ncbi:hypothetical protein Bca4012_088840 [Brassica carinata]
MEEEMNKRIMGGEALTVEDGNKSSWHLSVFTITADVIQATLEKFIKCEMDGYVSKPFAAEQLYRELSIFFNDFRYRIIRGLKKKAEGTQNSQNNLRRQPSYSWIQGIIFLCEKVDKAGELDDGGDNQTVVWLEDVGALVVTGLRWQRKKTIMTSRLS